jgi:uncharacterized lipoprotein YmbA
MARPGCLLILIALLGGACSSVNTRFYLLNPVRNGEPASASEQAIVVEISRLQLPQYLERPQIVSRRSDNRLVLAEFSQWAGNLRKNMMRVMAENLSRQLATPMIAIAPDHAVSAPDARIELEIMQFERLASGKVSLIARWRLFDKDDKLFRTHTSRLLSEPLAAAADYDATVSTMSELLGELSRNIATAILNQL